MMRWRAWLLRTSVVCAAACGGDEVIEGPTCGPGTVEQNGQCVPIPGPDPLVCGPGTVEVDGECVLAEDPPLEPNDYQAPLVQLQRLQGDSDHMHVSQVKFREADQKLFFCSYTFGMIDAENPEDMDYEIQGLRHQTPSGSPRVPGCLHLAWDEDNPNLIYTSHRGNIDFARFLSGWDITDTDAPVQLPALQEDGIRYGGIDVENGLIYVALQEDGLGIYDYDATTLTWTRIGTTTLGDLDNAWAVQVNGTLAYVADGIGGLATVDVTDPLAPVFLGRAVFGGNAEDVVVDGTVAYVASGNEGLVIVDVANPAAPAVLSSAEVPGNAVAVAFSAGRAYVAGWNDVRAFDVADPSAPRLIGATRNTVAQEYEICEGDPEVCVLDDLRPDPTARTLAVAAHDDTLFVGNWWVPYSYRVHDDRQAPFIVVPEDAAFVDFGPTEIGQSSTRDITIRNDGTADLTLYDNWTTSSVFTVTPRQVRIAPGAAAKLTVTYTATVGTMERGLLHIKSDDPAQAARAAYLVGNQPGLGVGQMLPDTVAPLLDGSTFSTGPLTGNVMVLAYFATF